MSKSLLLASLMVAGVYAQSTPDPSLIKGGEFQHLGCVAIKPGTFPRQFDLGQAGCTSSCSTNGNIIAFHGKSCSCDRLDLSPKPIPYQVTKVDNSLCNQWCDPADKSKGTCGGATVRGWPVYDLYKRNDARVVFVPFPGDVATPVAPGQTPAPVPNDPGHKPGDVFHDCPPGVTDCPYRTQCPGGNCGGSKPIPQPCNGCSPPSGGKNWTAPGCPGGCPPGQNPTPGGGDQNGQGNQGGNGGNGDNGGQGGDNNGGAGGNGDGQDSGNGSQGGQSDSGSSGNGGDSGSGGSDSQSGSDATGGQDGSGQDGAGQGQGSDGTDSGSSAGGSGGSDQGSSGQGGQDDQSGCTGSACPTPVSLGIKAEAGSLMFAVVAGVLVGLW
ncbi:hypothetical protein CDV36_008067 [Fusarium kuroshium]|uniref:WSC domain-containing protein n=1 Tax=Fusarium kuroshium TaxID=2010991 RepID=A0A3M2S4U8_9HYPO|nr:hypothetical protein CDV36_008067 [Fusarium kuroshium]